MPEVIPDQRDYLFQTITVGYRMFLGMQDFIRSRNIDDSINSRIMPEVIPDDNRKISNVFGDARF